MCSQVGDPNPPLFVNSGTSKGGTEVPLDVAVALNSSPTRQTPEPDVL